MISTILKGAAIGVAEVIPGVSGGTIAFITGIYERLLNCIKGVNSSLIGTFKSDGFKGVYYAIDGDFLAMLMGGMLVGIVIGIFGVTYLLEEYPTPVWGFFFGLIVASSIYIGKQIPKWDASKWIGLIIGFVIAFGITIITPTEGSDNLLMVFLAGTIAISALILPGISGSFMLLLMGMYTIIVPSLKSLLEKQDMASLTILFAFAMGCLVGLTGFSRVLTWLLKEYKYTTFAVLTGFMLGSLNKIWPWRNVTEVMDKESGVVTKLFESKDALDLPSDSFKILSEVNVLPVAYEMRDPLTIVTIVAVIVGFISVFLLERANKSH